MYGSSAKMLLLAVSLVVVKSIFEPRIRFHNQFSCCSTEILGNCMEMSLSCIKALIVKVFAFVVLWSFRELALDDPVLIS